MQQRNPKELLVRYNLNQCTEEEKAWLESWYLNWNKDVDPNISEKDLMVIEQEMFHTVRLKEKRATALWPMLAGTAAAVLVVLSIGLYISKDKHVKPKAVEYTEVPPGGNKAVLILANGKRINLEDAKSGALAVEGNVHIKKAKDGQLVYDLSKASSTGKITYNTIETPRSGTYQVILPDGSSVWLNAASRLKFPSTFSGNERKVELAGEAYFEVAKNKQEPFRVISDHQVIEVLGTHFNANNYKDEPLTQTTLLEGSVKVSSGSVSRTIKPGEQAQLNSDGIMNIVSVETEPIIAWKNGVFSFKRADLKTVMRQIARWYDINVEYGDEIPNISFTGKIYRNVNLQEALKSIGYLDVKYKITGKTVSIESE